MALFDVEQIAYSSKTQDIIKGISLKIHEGETVAITGKSGCGKSTLLKLIAGILVPTGGRCVFDGNDINVMTKAQNLDFRCRCSFMFQDAALWANQDILSNLSLPLEVHYPALTARERLTEIENMCKLVKYDRALSLRPADLSMGEQKRIAFARAMIIQPDVLFLDECTESLDSRGVQVIIRLLHQFEDAGKTMVYVTHSATFANEFKGTQYVIDNGVLVSSTLVGDEVYEI